MALQKQAVNIDFGAGLDTKTDPFQIAPGHFLALTNTVFQDGKRLSKRNGYAPITNLPDGANVTTLTTFQDNLTAIGSQVYAFSQASDQWEAKGRIQPISKSVKALVRSGNSQTASDTAITPNGLVATVFNDGGGVYKYTISDYTTGQQLVGITALPAGANVPRVYSLGAHIVITFLITITATPHLQYIAIPIYDISNPSSAVNVSSVVNSTTTSGYDGAIVNDTLYLAYEATGGDTKVTYIDSVLTQHTTATFAGRASTRMSVTGDTSGNTPVIWITAYAATQAYSWAVNQTLVTILAPVHSITGTTVISLTSSATDGLLSLFYEVSNTYAYSAVRSDFIDLVTLTQAGVLSSVSTILRSVGLASESFLINNVAYMLVAYSGAFQPTYFLIDETGKIVSKLAYSNGNGYATTQVLPGVSLLGSNEAFTSYLIKDLLLPVNKNVAPDAPGGIFTQTGVNLVRFNFAPVNLSTVEIGGSRLIAGGITWMYDGVKPVELGFNVWPEDMLVTTATGAGSITAQNYNYVAVYEWTDGQGNVHRSAPSVPFPITTTTASSTNTVKVPTLRLTYKITPNIVRIVLYRWSTAQPIFYQITSITSPVANDPTVDSITYVDTAADSSIISNNILYTTGGVIENIAPPGTANLALYGDRVFLVDDEDKNLLWYSKQVIETTPVEMSDLFTIFVAPTSGAQGSTGELSALSPMDDKLIMFKPNAEYYLVGRGPDNTGAQNDFSDPVFINSTIGCSNQSSIAFIPSGLIFQSDKGIWLLNRNLSTSYIGDAVESFNSQLVTSAVVIPGANNVRFTLAAGSSSTLYQDLHTVINSDGQVCQESPGAYLDGNLGTMLMFDYYYTQWGTFTVRSGPTLMSFTTGWLNLAGVQGSERAYFFTLLGQFLSPHKLYISIAYDYAQSPAQDFTITPQNYAGTYGDSTYSSLYGAQSPYGGPGSLEQWRIFFTQQKLQSFQISIQEEFNPTYATVPGAGFTLSGMNLVVGMRKGYTHNVPATNYAS